MKRISASSTELDPEYKSSTYKELLTNVNSWKCVFVFLMWCLITQARIYGGHIIQNLHVPF